jgi:hypothetical protein
MTRRTLSLTRETLSDLTNAQLEDVQAAGVLTGTETRWCPSVNATVCYTLLPRGECA